jgi:glycosyltransferase involved in cell wall biosynthesis
MYNNKFKVLLIVEQCNPDWASVPLVGYKFFQGISNLVDVTLVTHERNKKSLKQKAESNDIVYIPESALITRYYSLISKVTKLLFKDRINWPLSNALNYPIYAEFNHKVYKQFKDKILRGDYDIVHALTPMMPRYPVKVVKVCKRIPFLLGPVNGGVPFPPGFQETAKQEFAQFNFLRAIGRALIPGYVETYKQADRILSGSTYTLNMLKQMFKISDDRISLFYENGISSNFLNIHKTVDRSRNIVELLFVGRLVPYKCADVVIEAVGQLDQELQNKIHLTIVGDGSEKSNLEAQVQRLNLENIVTLTGWVKQEETLDYYKKADVFCFPSIREFGGAVVLEAMACGLPCIVANNGGIGEYVTEATGFKIEPVSREYLTQQLTQKIKILVEDETLRKNMSNQAIERVRAFAWDNKAQKIVEIYEEMVKAKKMIV